MHLLYLDDSGSPADPAQKFFVMAGVSLFERQVHWLDGHLTEIAKRFNPADDRQVEMHGNPMRSGADGWKQFSVYDRSLAMADALTLLSSPQMKAKVFACVVEKANFPNISDIIPHAFESIATQFDNYLASMYAQKNPQRGLVIFDKADFEKNIQALSHTFKHNGHATGKLRNFAEVPLFIDSKASRMIQMADLVAYWIFRRYEALDDNGFKLIEPYFHSVGGDKRGLRENITQATLTTVKAAAPPKFQFPPPSGLAVILPAAIPTAAPAVAKPVPLIVPTTP